MDRCRIYTFTDILTSQSSVLAIGCLTGSTALAQAKIMIRLKSEVAAVFGKLHGHAPASRGAFTRSHHTAVSCATGRANTFGIMALIFCIAGTCSDSKLWLLCRWLISHQTTPLATTLFVLHPDQRVSIKTFGGRRLDELLYLLLIRVGRTRQNPQVISIRTGYQ